MLDRIGQIVRTVRTRADRALEDVSARSGVPAPLLDALEHGKPGITTKQLEGVAVELSLDPIALLQGQEIARSIPSVFLRHQGATQDFSAADFPLLDEAVEQGRTLAALQKLLHDSPAALQAARFHPHEAAAHKSDAPAREGYQLAREVRHWLGNVAEPLGDLRALIEERFGIAVLVRRLESKGVTAVCVRAEDSAAIVLEAKDPQRAQNSLLGRVYLAHELCHALFDPSGGGVHVVVDFVLDRKAHQSEQRARAFAAELLLPLQGIQQMAGAASPIRSWQLALDLIGRARSHFGTPHAIAANQLCNQGLIDSSLREFLETEVSSFSGPPHQTELPHPDEGSLLVADLTQRAHEAELITDGEARSMLGLDRLEPLPWEAEP